MNKFLCDRESIIDDLIHGIIMGFYIWKGIPIQGTVKYKIS